MAELVCDGYARGVEEAAALIAERGKGIKGPFSRQRMANAILALLRKEQTDGSVR